jgi:hypothetical protein
MKEDDMTTKDIKVRTIGDIYNMRSGTDEDLITKMLDDEKKHTKSGEHEMATRCRVYRHIIPQLTNVLYDEIIRLSKKGHSREAFGWTMGSSVYAIASSLCSTLHGMIGLHSSGRSQEEFESNQIAENLTLDERQVFVELTLKTLHIAMAQCLDLHPDNLLEHDNEGVKDALRENMMEVHGAPEGSIPN